MKTRKVITSLMAGTFIMVLVTGMLIFFEISFGGIRATHEWVSLMFGIVAVLHIATYRKSFISYFTTKYSFFICATFVFGLGLFSFAFNDLYAAGAAFDLLISLDIGQMASVLSITENELVAIIVELGVIVDNPQDSIEAIAVANNMDVYDLIEPLLQAESI